MITAAAKKGYITQVIGSTFDVEFDGEHLPEIYNAVTVKAENKGVSLNLVGEVQQHIGGSRVRCVALGSTDGLTRGMDAIDTGGPVTVPVGMETLGRVFNLLGQPIDGRGPITVEGDARHPPQAAAVREPVAEVGNSRDRHQGHRPAHAARSRWQGGLVRRGRARQDGYSHRADRSYRQGVQGLFGVRRRRRTNPRGQRPLAGNAGDQGRRSGPTPSRSSSRRRWSSAR